MNKVGTANKVVAAVREKSDSCILFCSLGKDSLVCLDLLYSRFERIICVFMYFVKGLDHIERWIGWLKAKYPKIEFMQCPHWNLAYVLRSGMYCVPNPKIKLFKLADIVKSIRLQTGVYYTCLGMKKADGMNRNLMLKTYEASNYENDGLFYPLAEWNQKDVISYMKQHGLPEPVRYGKKASNGIGFNEDCFLWLRDNFPQDLEKIYNVFPMSRRILFEYDNKQKE